MGLLFDNSSKYYFQLSVLINMVFAAPSVEVKIIVEKRAKTSTSGEGAYMLKYETSLSLMSFATTNQSGNLGKSVTANIPLVSC